MKFEEPGRLVLILMALGGFSFLSLSVHSANASGLAFGTVLNLSNDVEDSTSPRVALSGPNVYVTWQNSTFDSNPNIIFAKSTDNGTSFGPVTSLSGDDPAAESTDQQIIAAGSNVYIVWVDNSTAGNYEIFFVASADNGTSFGSIVNLSNDLGTSLSPRLAAVGTDVYVAWEDLDLGNVFFLASNNAGIGFGTVQDLSNDGTASFPEMTASGSRVYVSWRDFTGAFDLVLRASTDHGATFGPVVNLSNNLTTGSFSFAQQMASTGTSVYIVWSNSTITNDDIVLRGSLSSGSTFGSIIPLTTNGASINPRMAAAGAYVHVVWEDHSGFVSAVSYARSSDDGISFAPDVPVSGSGFPTYPQVAAAGTNIFIMWEDTDTSDVFFRASSDNGASFSSEVNLSNSGDRFSGVADLAGTETRAYVAWEDDTPGNLDILFRAGSPKGPGGSDTEPPSWPGGSSLTASSIGPTSLRLTWSAATDNVAVQLYRVYQDSTLLVTLDVSTRAYEVLGLSPGTTYTFKIEAGDAASNWSTDGPSTSPTTRSPPVLDPIGPKAVDEQTQLSFTVTASDPDNDPLTFSLGSPTPSGASIASGGLFSWTPTENQGPGTYTLTVVASDGAASDSETITVTVREVNRPPVWATVSSKDVVRGSTLTANLAGSVSDPDVPAQTLLFSLTPGMFPAGATITTGGTFTWTPSTDVPPGDYTVGVTVSDGESMSSQQFTVTVQPGGLGPAGSSWLPYAAIGSVVIVAASMLLWFRWKRKT